MSTTPKRYQFSNPMPPVEPRPLPVRRPAGSAVEPFDLYQPAEQPQQQVVVQHIHQAPPDRTLQRVALGAGMGAGAVASAVYFGPMLAATLTFMTIWLVILALVIALIVWPIAMIVRSAGRDPGGKSRR